MYSTVLQLFRVKLARPQPEEKQARCDPEESIAAALAVSPVNGLVHHSAFVGGMNDQPFDIFLAETRTNLDPDEEVIFIYGEARQLTATSLSQRSTLSSRSCRPIARFSTTWSRQ